MRFSLALAPIWFVAACGGARPTPLANLGGAGALCVPATWSSTDEYRPIDVRVAATANGLAMCASSYGGPTDCRALDLARGALGAAVPTDNGYQARSTHVPSDDGESSATAAAIDGFPIPAGSHLFTRAPDGAWAAAIGDKIYLLEKGAAAPSHALDLMVDDGNSSIGNAPVEAIIRGDRLYIRGSDAGPFEDTTAFGRDGSRIGKVPLGDYGGSFAALDAHRVAGSDAALQTLTIYDERGTATTIHRAHPALRCTAAQIENSMIEMEGGDDSVPAECQHDLHRYLGPYADIGLAATGDAFVTVLHTGGLGQLALLSSKDLSVVASRPLAICR